MIISRGGNLIFLSLSKTENLTKIDLLLIHKQQKCMYNFKEGVQIQFIGLVKSTR